MNLTNKIALVTGAADGIGAACARELGALGATVVLTDINAAGAAAVAESIGANAMAIAHDVCDPAAWQAVMDTIGTRYGKLDILVNNAGGAGGGTIESTELDFYHNCMTLNVDSVFIGCKLAIELMRQQPQGGGSIINIASIHGLRGAPHAAAYTAAKGAVTMLTKSVARHCAMQGYNIRCNSVHPGYILTTQLQSWIDSNENPAAVMQELVSKHPIGFLGAPTDIAKGVAYLASDDARFVTGSELVIDGGFCL
jgi:NAD(P)-dependent dehydrogenase (short-subunit alcohol dehydrogenase family)